MQLLRDELDDYVDSGYRSSLFNDLPPISASPTRKIFLVAHREIRYATIGKQL